jgi:predicted neuraminidase
MEGRLRLFYKIGHTIPDWKTMYTDSFDGGVTWSEERELVLGDESGGRGPVKNKPIRLKNGAILAPASHEQGSWRCFTDLSRDDGRTWERSEYIPMPDDAAGVIQPSLWEDNAGVHMLMRSNTGFIWRADSPDGMHWGTAYPTAMPNNNSGLDLVPVSDRLVLCCNPITYGRTLLTLMESTDGIHFETTLVLENEPGEFSYPAVIRDGSKICGTYTWKRKKIVYFEAMPE